MKLFKHLQAGMVRPLSPNDIAETRKALAAAAQRPGFQTQDPSEPQEVRELRALWEHPERWAQLDRDQLRMLTYFAFVQYGRFATRTTYSDSPSCTHSQPSVCRSRHGRTCSSP